MGATAAATTLEIDRGRLMKILYVENEESIRTYVSEVLEGEGYKVYKAQSPKEAMEFFFPTPESFQVALVDIRFHDAIPNSLSGDEFIRKIKEYLKGTKVIAHTAYRWQIKRDNLDLFHDIINKGEEEKLYQEIDNIFQDELKAFQSRGYARESESENSNDFLLAREDIKRHQERLIERLKSVKNKDKPLVVFEDKEYSAVDLVKEIENETEIGKSHIKLMLDYLENEG